MQNLYAIVTGLSALIRPGETPSSKVIELRWSYPAGGPGDAEPPAAFAVYGNGGIGEIHFAQPVAQITCRGTGTYHCRCDVPVQGRYFFCVRPIDSSGRDIGAGVFTLVDVRSDPPGDAQIILTRQK